MYTVVMGAGRDRDRALAKARAVAALPRQPADLTVVLVHADGGDDSALDRTAEFLGERDIETTVETASADPPTALVKVAADRDADLLCVGGRQHSPAGKMQLRGGAQSVILNTDRPVLVAGGPTDH